MSHYTANSIQEVLDTVSYHDGVYAIPTEYLIEASIVNDGHFRNFDPKHGLSSDESLVICCNATAHGEYVGTIRAMINYDYLTEKYADKFGVGLWELHGDHGYKTIMYGIGCDPEMLDDLIALQEQVFVFDESKYESIQHELYFEAWKDTYHQSFIQATYRKFVLNDATRWFLQDCESVDVDHLYEITMNLFESLIPSGDFYHEVKIHVECNVSYAIRNMDRDQCAKLIRDLRKADREHKATQSQVTTEQ